ncbi:MAG: class I SAM-dependent methyltransferase, partial [Terriglobales bacterium]
MSSAGQPIRNVSDTALWTAVYRARESERSDPLFYDPYARRLAGERGMRIADAIPFAQRNEWSFTARTYLFDQLITQEIHQGADLVLNLAAGLDTRPYRMALPARLQWIEVDLPEILDYKEEILGSEAPVCQLVRMRLDLADGAARRALFQRLAEHAQRVLILTEGLLIYFTPEQVGVLARDLAAPAAFQRWILDL